MTCEAKTMARKMIVPTTKMMTIMKTTQSTPGTIEQSSVMYSLKSDGGHCTWCDHIHTTFLGVTLQLIGKQSNVGETILGENHTFEGKSTKQKKESKNWTSEHTWRPWARCFAVCTRAGFLAVDPLAAGGDVGFVGNNGRIRRLLSSRVVVKFVVDVKWRQALEKIQGRF